ncbi:MAG: hypothetical protein KME23_27580 [Goleter apudmare HA4340-LM2]|jgi:hypothetical protein|nr:hypothetical protein [Goleter apudmare HA4340-LM2]
MRRFSHTASLVVETIAIVISQSTTFTNGESEDTMQELQIVGSVFQLN